MVGYEPNQTTPSRGINKRMKRKGRNRLHDQPDQVSSFTLASIVPGLNLCVPSSRFPTVCLSLYFSSLVTSSNWDPALLVARFRVYRGTTRFFRLASIERNPLEMKVLAEGHPVVIEGLSVRCLKIVDKKLSGLD